MIYVTSILLFRRIILTMKHPFWSPYHCPPYVLPILQKLQDSEEPTAPCRCNPVFCTAWLLYIPSK